MRSQEQPSETYAKLVRFLEVSTQYRADRLLGRLPADRFFEIRAALLGRLGQHEGALTIYVHRLKDFETAASYCRRVGSGDVYLTLLRIYLRPKGDQPLLLEPAFDLLSRYGAKVEIAEVLDLLPPLSPLRDARVFLSKAMRHAVEVKRGSRVTRDVFRSYTDQLDADVATLESRRVLIDDNRLCPSCHKRLGGSVLAVFSPHGETTHLACSKAFSSIHAASLSV